MVVEWKPISNGEETAFQAFLFMYRSNRWRFNGVRNGIEPAKHGMSSSLVENTKKKTVLTNTNGDILMYTFFCKTHVDFCQLEDRSQLT